MVNIVDWSNFKLVHLRRINGFFGQEKHNLPMQALLLK